MANIRDLIDKYPYIAMVRRTPAARHSRSSRSSLPFLCRTPSFQGWSHDQ